MVASRAPPTGDLAFYLHFIYLQPFKTQQRTRAVVGVGGVELQIDSEGRANGFRSGSGLGTNRSQGGFQACPWA